MYPMQVKYTAHALNRRAQRNLSHDDIAFVLRYGRRYHCAGVLHVCLGRRDIPGDRELMRRYGRLEGTTLVLKPTCDGLVLVTAYRNRRSFKHVRAKRKYEWRAGCTP